MSLIDVYLSGATSQLLASHCAGMNVLISYAGKGGPWLHDGYQQSYAKVMIDSGAYSEMTQGKVVDLNEYADWAQAWKPRVEAIAGLDDIKGDYHKSIKNFEALPWTFPTFHTTDPFDILDDLIAMAVERKTWLGLGCPPPRGGREGWIRKVCERVPPHVHIHGFALRGYTHIRRLNSVDSTNWFRDAFKLKTNPELKHLTYMECLDIIIKRYQRWQRGITPERPSLFRRRLSDDARVSHSTPPNDPKGTAAGKVAEKGKPFEYVKTPFAGDKYAADVEFEDIDDMPADGW